MLLRIIHKNFRRGDESERQYRSKLGFTMIELLMVIGLISFITGMIIGLSSITSSKMRLARVRGELSQLVTSIELYKAKYGVYPPDNQVKDGNGFQVLGSSATNQLVLELSGCLVTNKAFSSPYIRTLSGGDKLVTSSELQGFFGNPVDGILNASEKASKTRNFLDNYSNKRFGLLTNISRTFTINILKVPVEAPLYQAALVSRGKGWRILGKDNPWHYNSTDPTNNPGKFDLWAEFQLGKQGTVQKDDQGRYVEYYVIGNWNDSKPEIRKDYF